MGKFKNFLKCFDEDLAVFTVIFLFAAAVSIGMQSLLIWLGGLIPSSDDWGLITDAFIGFLLIYPLLIGACFTEHKGNGNLILIILAITGIYVCIGFWFNWYLLLGCIFMLWLNLKLLDKIVGFDPMWPYGGVCIYLLYCVGLYFAMLLTGCEPAADTYGITVLSLATLYIWFKPSFN